MNRLYKYLMLVFTSMLLLSFTGKKGKNDLTKDGLMGKVKLLVTSYYNAKDTNNEVVKYSLNYKVIDWYNNNGNITEAYASLKWKNYFIYGPNGNLVLQKMYSLDSVLISKDTCMYDNENNLIKKNELIIPHDSADYGDYFMYKYDDSGNLKEENEYRYNRWYETWKYYYNSKGKIVETKDSNAFGDINIKSSYKYNENGELIEVINVGRNSTSKTTYKPMKYDSKGNWLKEIVIGEDVEIIEREINYY
jgi:hypothetical protein